MGVTGSNGFPCCGKNAVEIVERPNDYSNQQPSQPYEPQEEDELELEAELLEQECPITEDLVPNLEPMENLETEPASASEPEPGARSPDQQDNWIESLKACGGRLPTTQNFRHWSISSNASSTEEDEGSLQHRSVLVQTSRDLFWADKLIQASEQSLQRAMEKQCNESTEKTTSHAEQKSVPSAQPPLPATSSQPPPSPCPSSSNLPQAIGLVDLVNFASSLAIASSSSTELPNLEHMIKAPPQRAREPSPKPIRHPMEEPDLPEKLPEAVELRRDGNQEDRNFPCSYLDFSKPGTKRATIEGEVKFLQTPALARQLQGAKEDSVTGTKTGNPLWLQIHFKLSAPSIPEK